MNEKKKILDELIEQSRRILRGEPLRPQRRAVNPERECDRIMKRDKNEEK